MALTVEKPFNQASGANTLIGRLGAWISSLWNGEPENEESAEPEYDPYSKATRPKMNLSQVFNSVTGHTVETERLVIRRWTADDALKMAQFFNRNNGLYQTYYFDRAKAEHLHAKDFHKRIFRQLDRDYPHDVAIFTKDQKRIIGTLGFWEDGYGRPHLTYFVSPTERRHGYAFEAYMAKLKEFAAFGSVRKMVAQVAAGNTASQEFLKKAGFVAKGEMTADCSSIEGKPSVLMERDMADMMPAAQPQ